MRIVMAGVMQNQVEMVVVLNQEELMRMQQGSDERRKAQRASEKKGKERHYANGSLQPGYFSLRHCAM